MEHNVHPCAAEFSKEGPFYCGKELSLFEMLVWSFADNYDVFEVFYPGEGLNARSVMGLATNERLAQWYEAMKAHDAVKAMHAQVKEVTGKELKDTVAEVLGDSHLAKKE